MDIAYLLYNAIRIIIMCRLGSLFLKEARLNKLNRILLLLCFITTHSLIYLCTDDRNITMATNFILFIVYTIGYNGTIFNRLFSFIMSYIINILCEGAIYYLILNFKLTPEQSLLFAYISVDLFFFIVEEIIRTAFKHNEYDDVEIRYKALFLIIPFGSLYLCKVILDTYIFSATVISAVIVLFMINIAFYCILKMVSNSYKRVHEQEIIKRDYKYYKTQIDLIQKNYENTSSSRHDYKNHALTLKGYIHNSEMKKAEKYIDEMLDNLDVKEEIVKSGNWIIDNLFNYKLGVIKNVNYNIDILIPEDLFIPDYDFSIIIGNLLDNSIKALEETNDRTLNVSIKYKLQALHIVFSNSYSGRIKMDGNRFATTKQDKQNHGYGLKNIEEVVKRHNGKIEYFVHNNIFTVKILLWEPETEC